MVLQRDTPLARVLARLQDVERSGTGWVARCPAHDDRRASLSISEGADGRILLKCHAGCDTGTVVRALGLKWADLFPGSKKPRGKARSPEETGGTPGLRLVDYAKAKALPLDFLRGVGLHDQRVYIGGEPQDWVAVPYLDEQGNRVAVRYRLALTGPDRFRWRKGDKALPYGLWRLPEARERGFVVLVEGESDCHTLWLHDFPALGIPGAGTWRVEWARHLDGIATVYVVQEPDLGGDNLLEKLVATPGIPERLRVVRPQGWKDPSELYLQDASHFKERMQAALDAAPTWAELQAHAAREAALAALEGAGDLARDPDILGRLREVLPALGIAGEQDNACLLYLAITSRLLPRPVNVRVGGPAAAGKSWLVDRLLPLFPPEAVLRLTGLSPRFLFYLQEPLSHRMILVEEATGLDQELVVYAVRSLLSEGRLRWGTVFSGERGPEPALIEKEGPTGLIVTTTRTALDPELETRLFAIALDDSPGQTARILAATARAEAGELPPFDPRPWVALQEWLQSQPAQVVVPWAGVLARLTRPAGVRLRRDFGTVLRLVQAHALLHWLNRETDAQGRVIAALDDYRAVYPLVRDLVEQGLRRAVRPAVRELVELVRRHWEERKEALSVREAARLLGIDPATASRRAREAIEAGLLLNEEDRPRRPARLVPGAPLPEEPAILPPPEVLGAALREGEGAGTPAACNSATAQQEPQHAGDAGADAGGSAREGGGAIPFRATVQQQAANTDGRRAEAVATGVSTGVQQQHGLREVVIP